MEAENFLKGSIIPSIGTSHVQLGIHKHDNAYVTGPCVPLSSSRRVSTKFLYYIAEIGGVRQPLRLTPRLVVRLVLVAKRLGVQDMSA